MKISFANSIGDLAMDAGANPEKILSAIGSDSRIGEKYLRYGFGFGGPCFPRDNRALQSFARNIGHELPLSKATDKVNETHLDFQAHHILKTSSPEEKIVFECITYNKKSVSLEESQQLALALQLARSGRKVVIRERENIVGILKEKYSDLFQYQCID